MTDADLDACRAAFPALVWSRSGQHQYFGLSRHHTVTVHMHPAGGAEAHFRRRLPRGSPDYLVEGLGGDAASGLVALRREMAAVRDDLTVALGEK